MDVDPPEPSPAAAVAAAAAAPAAAAAAAAAADAPPPQGAAAAADTPSSLAIAMPAPAAAAAAPPRPHSAPPATPTAPSPKVISSGEAVGSRQALALECMRSARPHTAVAQFQRAHALRLEPAAAAAVEMLDALRVPRLASARAVLDANRTRLVRSVGSMAPARRRKLLVESFRFVTVPEMRAVPLALLTARDAAASLPAEIKRALSGMPELLQSLPRGVRQAVWEAAPSAFQAELAPHLQSYAAAAAAASWVQLGAGGKLAVSRVRRQVPAVRAALAAVLALVGKNHVLAETLCRHVLAQFRAARLVPAPPAPAPAPVSAGAPAAAAAAAAAPPPPPVPVAPAAALQQQQRAQDSAGAVGTLLADVLLALADEGCRPAHLATAQRLATAADNLVRQATNASGVATALRDVQASIEGRVLGTEAAPPPAAAPAPAPAAAAAAPAPRPPPLKAKRPAGPPPPPSAPRPTAEEYAKVAHAKDCGACPQCRDKPKFGGPSAMRGRGGQCAAKAKKRAELNRVEDAHYLQARDAGKGLDDLVKRSLDALKTVDHGNVFAQVVTDAIAANYSKIIAKPVALSTLRAKLRKRPAHGGFRHYDDFLADVSLMFDNCERYNGRESEYGKYAATAKAAWGAQSGRFRAQAALPGGEGGGGGGGGGASAGKRGRGGGDLTSPARKRPRVPGEGAEKRALAPFAACTVEGDDMGYVVALLGETFARAAQRKVCADALVACVAARALPIDDAVLPSAAQLLQVGGVAQRARDKLVVPAPSKKLLRVAMPELAREVAAARLKGMDVARFVSEDVASTEAWRAVMARIGKAPTVAALAAALKRDVARAAKVAKGR